MTLSARHRITYALFLISLVLNGVILYFFISRYSELREFYPLNEAYQRWWFIFREQMGDSFFLNSFAGLCLSTITLIGSLILFIVFKQSSSQEIFYVQLFLLCLSFYSIRYLSYLVPFYRLPLSYTVLITRGVFFFRFNSLLFLVLSGLSVFDSRFQKSDPFFLSAIVIALSLSAAIPISDIFVQNTLTLTPVNEMSLFFLFLIVEMIIPLNFLWFLYQRKTMDYLVLTLTMILFIAAENLLFYMAIGGFIAGLILLVLGAVLFSHRIYRLYLWR